MDVDNNKIYSREQKGKIHLLINTPLEKAGQIFASTL